MILDLIIKQNTCYLKIHKKFFQNESFPLTSFQIDSPLMQKYSYLGVFHISGAQFGFDGCFQLQKEENDYIVYTFDLPAMDNNMAMRKMLLKVYLATYYVVEQMYYHKEFFSETIWDDQGLTFVIFDGGRLMNGYSIGGQLYPWFKKRLASLTDEGLANINKYVLLELNRIALYLNEKELYFSQVTIRKESFFIEVNINGRWISWHKSRAENKQEDFSSHNIDFRSDQEICFLALIAINTWLREN